MAPHRILHFRFAASEWGPCNSTCNLGFRTRTVYCQLSLQAGVTVKLNDSWCAPNSKATEEVECYGAEICDSSEAEEFDDENPTIEALKTTFVHVNPLLERLTFKVGMNATVFEGSTVRVTCPVRKFNGSLIRWKKDGDYLELDRKVNVTEQGTLRIASARFRYLPIFF